MNFGQVILQVIQFYVGRFANMKKILLTIVAALFLITACGGNNSPSAATPTNPGSLSSSQLDESSEISQDPDTGDYDKIYENYAHFLLFEVDGVEIARMLTIPTDTYDSLAPFFPTIPEQQGFIGYWERVDKVYDSNVRLISIVAYYSKI